MRKIIIGSRGSDLALWQAKHVKGQLESLGYLTEIKIIVTQGDAIQHLSFDKMEGKGFFTKEIEKELLNKSIDLAIHSHKDLETDPPAGLTIAAVSERANPCDLLLISKNAHQKDQRWKLKVGGIIGTSSARRQSLVRAYRPDCELLDLRGNVPTRIQKLRDGKYDAILLAKAGVDRLEIDLSEFEMEVLNPEQFVPAPAQGVLGLQIREDDTFMKKTIAKLNVPEVAEQIAIERKVLNLMDGGCQLPLGVYCENSNIYVAYAPNKKSAAQNFHFKLDPELNMALIISEELKALT
jgi:hydroxymethylbilane synthase